MQSDLMRPWRARAANIVPDMPPAGGCIFGPDMNSGNDPDGMATYHNGVEQLQLRAGYPSTLLTQAQQDLMVENTSNHEAGHPQDGRYTEQLRAHHAAYWSFRGFPGTWDQAKAGADAQGIQGWQFQPGESWAELFGIALSGRYTWPLINTNSTAKEKTYDFGLGTPTPEAARAFFIKLAGGTFMARFISDDLAIQLDAAGGAVVVVPIPGSAGFIAGQKVACDAKRIGLTGNETALPIAMPAVGEDTSKGPTADGRFYVRTVLKGDPVHSGTGYLKVSAWQ